MPLNNFTHIISWSEFTHVPSRPEGVEENAEINCHFPHTYQFGKNKGAVTIASAEVNISTIPAKCWVVSDQKTDYLLQHEQSHYDILALCAREFYNKILTYTASTEDKLEKRIKHLNADLQQKVNKIDKRYDLQTKHSQDKAKQQEWDKKIAAEKQKPDGSIDNLPG
jgi:predicted secreted Zn-dependent protease